MADAPPRKILLFEGFRLDLGRACLLAPGGAELALRPKAFDVLRHLAENAGRLVPRDELMQAVWPNVFVTDDSITQCVAEVRRALGDGAQRLLRTVPRRGYLFAAEALHAPPLPAVLSGDEPRRASRDGAPDDLAEQRPPGGAAEPAGLSSTAGAERRHLTVLFCGLVGSTALAEQLDPEDLGGVMRGYRERCAAAIARCGGHVASYAGDGVLAFFGYPHAREDAPERAVHAGLAIAETAEDPRPDAGSALQVRVGIATGLVVDAQAGEGARETVAVGKPLNLAARLQEIAAPGTVVIAESTRRLLGALFALEDLGPRLLRGYAAPVKVWRVAGDGVAEGRFEALRGANPTPMVGRRQELTLLLDRWEQAKEGEGQAVLLVGEPGIGKSRLVQALRDHLAGEPHVHLGCYCSQHRRDSPLRPVIAHLERAANFTRSDDPGERLAKLETLLAVEGGKDDARLLPLIASLLLIPGGGLCPSLDISPQLQRERTLAALVDQLAGLAAHRPVLLVWEDVHWADPTSLELLGLTLDRLRSLRVLALVTFRAEFMPPWPGHTHVTSLTLNRLGRQRCSELLLGLTGGKPLPEAVLGQIVAKADGVPLFLEELAKAVLESGLLQEEHGRLELGDPLPPLAVPETLQDSLMARLDNLAPVKEVAQTAAAIGREFSRELLAAVVPREDELAEALRRLVAAELVFPRGTAPHATYAFKHALVRDAAYAGLLKDKRRQLHAQIAQVLEQRFGQTVEAEPDVLARHWAEAGEAKKAAVYRLKAGERALARSATVEAVAQLTMGRELLRSIPDGDARSRAELDLQTALGAALSAGKGQAALETKRAYARARELCGELGEERRLVPVLLGLWGSHNARDELGAARAVAAELLQLAGRKGDDTASILGHRALGATLFGLGEFPAAREHLERLLALDCQAVRRSPSPLPYDPCVSGRAWLSLTLSVLGHPEKALAQADKALADAHQLQHQNTVALALSLRCSVGQFLGDHLDVAKHACALLAIALERGFAYWEGLGAYFRGWARAEAGETTAGIEEMRRALAACETTGAQAYVPYNLALLADICRRAGDAHQGRTLLDEALDRLRKTDARYCEAELLRIDGELRLAASPQDREGAKTSFKRAIHVAARQNAKITELRAAMGLARLWADDGRQRQACDLLAPLYGRFTEGFATKPVVEAKLLIDALV